MPYSSNSELPASVKDALPADAQTVFRRVFNQNIDDKGEASAMAIAWTAVKNGWKKQGDEWVAKANKFIKPLYVSRKLLNAQELIDWAKESGFENTLAPEDMHVTVLYSKGAVDWFAADDADANVTVSGGARALETFGKGATVLRFVSKSLAERHKAFRDIGATSDYPDYAPHVTISYSSSGSANAKPFQGDLVFGPEVFAEIDDDWKNKLVEKAEYQGREVELDKPFRTPGENKKFAVYVKDGDTVKIVRFGDPDMEIKRDDPDARANFRARHNCDAKQDKTTPGYWACKLWDTESVSELTKINLISDVFKTADEQRIVYGWASIITKSGEPVVDLQGDVIEADELVSSTTEFMKSVRTAKQNHSGGKIGTVVHSLPLTNEIAKSLGISSDQEGWIVGMHIENDDVWKSVKEGKLKAFSIGGSGVRQEIKQ